MQSRVCQGKRQKTKLSKDIECPYKFDITYTYIHTHSPIYSKCNHKNTLFFIKMDKYNTSSFFITSITISSLDSKFNTGCSGITNQTSFVSYIFIYCMIAPHSVSHNNSNIIQKLASFHYTENIERDLLFSFYLKKKFRLLLPWEFCYIWRYSVAQEGNDRSFIVILIYCATLHLLRPKRFVSLRSSLFLKTMTFLLTKMAFGLRRQNLLNIWHNV